MSNFLLSAFADEISPRLDEQIIILKEHQIGYVEFRSLENRNVLDHTPAELRRIAARLRDAGLAVSAIGSPIGKVSITDPFEPHLERFRKAITAAEILGTPNIRMFSFYIPEGEKAESYAAAVIERWQAFFDTAFGSGMTLLHENERGIFGESPENCLTLLKAMDSPLVRATFDPANFVQAGFEVYPGAFELLRPYIAYMHIKDARKGSGEVVPAGEGDGSLRRILKGLHEQGFQGFLSIEPHLNNNEPGGGAAQFARAANALKSILAELY